MKKIIIALIFVMLFLFTLAFCIKVLFTLDAYSAQIEHNEKIVLALPAKITQIHTAIEELNLKIKALESVDQANNTALDNLTKDKDTLFNKTGALEAKIEELKKADENLASQLSALQSSVSQLSAPASQ